jgi:hypothetical protein
MKFFTRFAHGPHRLIRYISTLLIILLASSACAPTLPFTTAAKLPIDVQALIPPDWVPLEGIKTINIDSDGQFEYLMFYRYDVQKGKESQGPIGGVIFDTEVDSTSGMARLVPHELLPDFSPGKGQGFLAEDRMPEYRVYDVNGDGANEELAITGYGHDSAFPMYLTVFRWQGAESAKGYQVVHHFYGDGGISVDPATSGPIPRVVEKTRLNDRSLLSKRAEYVREGDGYKLTSTSLDFTYDIPTRSYYPEGTVVAYYLLRNNGQSDLADRLLVPEVSRATLQSSLSLPAQALPSSEFVVPQSDQQALPLSVSYSGDANVAESAALGGTPGVPPAARLFAADVTIDVVENGQQVSRVWRVVNLPEPGRNGEPNWRLLGQH